MKILINPITSSSIAHTVRSLAVASELKSRGHQVTFTSDADRRYLIEQQGYDVVKTYPNVNINDPEDQSVNFLVSKKEGIKKWFQAEIDAAKQVEPDVIVAASGVFGPHQHYATGIPIVSIIDSQYLDESKGLMGLSKSTNKLTHRATVKALTPLFRKKFLSEYLGRLMDIYSELGLPTGIRSREEFYSPYSVIIPADHVLEPLSKPRKNTWHVGPIYWDGFENMMTDLTDEYIQEFKQGLPLVYLYFGGSVFDFRIYERVLSSLELMDTKVIVCLGPNWDTNQFPQDSDQVLYRKFVPGMKLSKYADVIVNTGAQGGVCQGLHHGKPQVCIPTIMDQAFFANRLEELGAGINVNKVGITKFSKRESFSTLPDDIPERIVAAIRKILQDGSYNTNSKNHMQIMREYTEPVKKAADIIERSALHAD